MPRSRIMPLPTNLLAADLAMLGETLRGRVNQRAGCANLLRQQCLKIAVRYVAGFFQYNVQNGLFAGREVTNRQSKGRAYIGRFDGAGTELPLM
jgi:hypothetical protein